MCSSDLIIAILAAILFPVFAQAKAAAKNTASVNNLKQIGLAGQMYLADNDDVMIQGDDYAEWIWLFEFAPYIKGTPPDFKSSKNNVFFSPTANASMPQYLAENRYDFLIETGLAAQWGLTPTTDPNGERAFAFWASYSINEHAVQEWPNGSSYGDPSNTFFILEANDTEIEGDELKKLYSRTVSCGTGEDVATQGGHAQGTNYAWWDGHVKFKKTGFAPGGDETARQCSYDLYQFPRGGTGGLKPPKSGVPSDCAEWTAPSDELDSAGNCIGK